MHFASPSGSQYFPSISFLSFRNFGATCKSRTQEWRHHYQNMKKCFFYIAETFYRMNRVNFRGCVAIRYWSYLVSSPIPSLGIVFFQRPKFIPCGPQVGYQWLIRYINEKKISKIPWTNKQNRNKHYMDKRKKWIWFHTYQGHTAFTEITSFPHPSPQPGFGMTSLDEEAITTLVTASKTDIRYSSIWNIWNIYKQLSNRSMSLQYKLH